MRDDGEVAVGIDLGTTYSVLARRDADGRPVTIPNAEGDATTPSVVYFHPTAAVVGKEAAKAALFEPDRVAQHAKRDMGRATYHQALAGLRIPPEVIQAFILRKLRADACLRLGEFCRAVITVPAYFNEPRRKATQDAGRLAGLEVLDLINEPTAAAIAFGVQEGFLSGTGEARQLERVLVFDLGGGTFDATLMELEGCEYRTCATAGDVFLGGLDWNLRIAEHLALLFAERHDVNLRSDRSAMQLLLMEAEDLKRALTARDSATARLAVEGRRLEVSFSRQEFEALTEDLLQRTLFTVSKLLRDAKVEWTDLTRLLLVGGSTRMPMIQRALTQLSGLPCDRSLAPDEAVAHGAAIYADLLLRSGGTRTMDLAIINVNSHDLGVIGTEQATGRKRRQILIARNTPLPATGQGVFVTGRDDQASVAVNVVEGGDASGNHATLIGKCVVPELPAGLPKRTPVEVKFHYGANGRLTVDAWLPTVPRQMRMVIERATNMTDALREVWAERIASGRLLDETPAQPENRPAPAAEAEREDSDEQRAESELYVDSSFDLLPDVELLDDSLESADEHTGPAQGNDDDPLSDFLNRFS